MQTMETAFQRACHVVGGQTRMAEVLGVSRQMICQVHSGTRRVPPRWCIPIEKETFSRGECVSRYELHPEVFGDPDGELHRGVIA
jgi:DNA-binding transcriptional regulator YdaS (Cro superfamily)